MQIVQTIPMLRIFDVGKAREFYLDYLGFTADWEHRFEPELPLYMQVSRGGLTLHLTEHHGDCCPGGAVFVWIEGLDGPSPRATCSPVPLSAAGDRARAVGASHEDPGSVRQPDPVQ